MGIGNTVLMLPLLHELSRGVNKYKITMLYRDVSARALIETESYIDEFVYYNNYNSGILTALKRIKLILGVYSNKFEHIVNLEQRHSILVTIFSRLLRSNCRIGVNVPKKYQHLYSHTLTFSENDQEKVLNNRVAKIITGKYPNISLPILCVLSKDINQFQGIDANLYNRIIGIHLGSGMDMVYKRWPIKRFSELSIRILSEPDNLIILFGGRGEELLGEEVVSRTANKNIINLIGKLSIRQTVTAMSKCSTFISNDSGLMHIAASMLIPTIALFGPTSIVKNSPLGDSTTIIYTDCCDRKNNELCPSCKERWFLNRTTPACLESISVDSVFLQI